MAISGTEAAQSGKPCARKGIRVLVPYVHSEDAALRNRPRLSRIMLKSVAVISVILSCCWCVSGQEQDKAQPPKELVQYVKDAQKAGQTPTQIQQNAVTAGWPPATVSDALTYVKSLDKPTAATEAKVAAPAENPAAAAARPPESAAPGETAPADTAARPPAESAAAPNKIPPPATDKTPDKGAAAGAPAAATDAGGTIPSPKANDNVPEDYQIGAGDVLKVTVWHEPDASVASVVVLPTGRVSLPLLHEVEVVGLTIPQLEKKLTDKLGTLLNTPEVSVSVLGMNSKKVYITGKVKKEGPLSLTYPMTVMQALSEAGGVTDYAKKKGIYVLRTEDGRQFKIPFDYRAVLKGEHLETNVPLIPGDMIVVP